MIKRVLVTGASGFIGRHTIQPLIEKGFQVHAVSMKKPLNIKNGCQWHIADLFNQNQVKDLVKRIKPTHLLHLAWYAVPGKYWTAIENFHWVQASLELLHQFKEQGGQRVVMAGTCAEYDWSYGYCSEFITPRKPNSPYGICKDALQQMINAYTQETEISSAWGRIFFLYGDYEPYNRLVPSVIISLLKGEVAKCSHGNQIRDFLYVQDVARALVALLDSDVQGVVNIASGQPVTLKEVIYKVANKIGKQQLVKLNAIPTSDQEPGCLLANVDRLSKEVQWKPQWTLDSGLDETINWWKKQDSNKI